MTASYLMRKYKMSAEDAKKLIKQMRPCMDMNPGFIKQLDLYQQVLHKYGLMSKTKQ